MNIHQKSTKLYTFEQKNMKCHSPRQGTITIFLLARDEPPTGMGV